MPLDKVPHMRNNFRNLLAISAAHLPNSKGNRTSRDVTTPARPRFQSTMTIPPSTHSRGLAFGQKITQRLGAVLTAFACASCSCAIHETSWISRNADVISESCFHQVAGEADFKAQRPGMAGYRKRDVYFLYVGNGRITLHSSFCPTPFTWVTRGEDLRAWHDRCQQAENSILESCSKRGMELQSVPHQGDSADAGQPASHPWKNSPDASHRGREG